MRTLQQIFFDIPITGFQILKHRSQWLHGCLEIRNRHLGFDPEGGADSGSILAVRTMKDQRKIAISGGEGKNFAPDQAIVVQVATVDADLEIEGKPLPITVFKPLQGSGRSEFAIFHWQKEIAKRPSGRESIW